MTQADIILATINAKYPHSAFGLRYLLANLGSLRGRAIIIELTDRERPADMAERILAHEPVIVGLGVYIWNATPARDLVRLLKRVRPDLCVVLGGPEVSHEIADQPITALADHVITGEGDTAFRDFCEQRLAGDRSAAKIIEAAPPVLDELTLPYDLYDAEDIAHRVIYVETARGCPHRCEFCASGLDRSVRTFDLEPFFAAIEALMARGATRFKLVDRSFNLDAERGARILDFFRTHYQPGLFLHLEAVPDIFPPALRDRIADFPPGALQLEIGIQTFNPEVAARVGRRLCPEIINEHLTFLRQQTRAHLHADLIAGLPGETMESFAAGFDYLVGLAPHEIQVGILKRLRGARISRHDAEWGMVYNDQPPYEVLATDRISFALMQRLKRFALLWDKVANSGSFRDTAPRLWGSDPPFFAFLSFCDWLFAREGRVHSIALDRLAIALLDYLEDVRGLPEDEIRAGLLADYTRAGRTKIPRVLEGPPSPPRRHLRARRSRQTRHQ